MKNWRTVVGAVCVVLAMVLMAVGGFAYARDAGIVGVSPDVGTRDTGEPVLESFDGPSASEAGAENPLQAFLPSEPLSSEITVDGGTATVRYLTLDELEARGGEIVYPSSDGSIRVESERVGTRSHLTGGMDLGGPYGGPDYFEGSAVLTFTVQVLNPEIILFRWDFNNDGVFDLPSQAGCPARGCWTTQSEVPRPYFDNYYDDIVVEGWDGITTYIVINTGDNLDQRTNYNLGLGMGGADYRLVGPGFRAKRAATVTDLGFYRTTVSVYKMYLWDVATRTRLGMCDPPDNTFSWNWCTLDTPVDLVLGAEYWLAQHIESSHVGFSPTPPDGYVANWLGTWGGFCYSWREGSPDNCFRTFQWSTSWIPAMDFRWTETLVLADSTSDSAFVEVHNVAPTVWGVTTEPTPALEGNPTVLTATFSDPGTDDDWEFRWTYADGTKSSWQSVSKMAGGAKVLFAHSHTGTLESFVLPAFTAACGSFCTTIDVLDIGPLGQNRAPTMDELLAYDVVVVLTNWGTTGGTPQYPVTGNRLADFMDAAGATGGGVVMLMAAFDNSNGDVWGIGGRWQSDKYSPIARSGYDGVSSSLGTIFVPGHPILDGVSSFTGALRAIQPNLQAGVRVANWLDGRVSIATNTNPIVDNGARAVALNMFPYSGLLSGDWARVMANAIRWASRQPDPTVKTMPMQLDPFKKVFDDDDPTTTTPLDTFPVAVEVRDDDHESVLVTDVTQLWFNDFQSTSECSWSTVTQLWPAGWYAVPPIGWRCQFLSTFGSRGATIQYYYNNFGTSNLYTGAFDFSGYPAIRLEWYNDWQGDRAGAYNSDAYFEISVDGGATWESIKEFHHMNPAGRQRENLQVDTVLGAGVPDAVFRFRYSSMTDYHWFVDNFRASGLEGEIVQGLGEAEGTVTVANVPPTIFGGFDSAASVEADSVLFKGYEVSDPALLAPTEWFALRWDMGDGTVMPWSYQGSFAVPRKVDVLVLHTLGSYVVTLQQQLESLAVVNSVTLDNYLDFTAPTLAEMMQYDVIIVAANSWYNNYAPFEAVKRLIGDNLAGYLDAGRGGVLTFMGVHDGSPGSPSIGPQLTGRYIDEQYGPFVNIPFLRPGINLGPVFEEDHEIMYWSSSQRVREGQVSTPFAHSGDYELTVGGLNNAAGMNGVLLSDWADFASAIGAKQLRNGMRTANIGAFANLAGDDALVFLRNAIGWVMGGIPRPVLSPFAYPFGDNGEYTITVSVIDDDMGYVWDAARNEPVAVLPGASMSQRFLTVVVDNADPVIQGTGIQAFIAAQVCVRISGTAGNTVTAQGIVDGVLGLEVSATRESGTPNPTTDKCSLLKVDVLGAHSYLFRLEYAAPNGGSNPTWLVIMPWREPISPGHGTIDVKYDFASSGAVVETPMPNLKQALLAGGKGAPIDFVAEACDRGSDDLAFVWSWGTVSGTAYDAFARNSVYTIHVFHNADGSRTNGVLSTPDTLGFSEPYFVRSTNVGVSGPGATNMCYRDTAVHAFDMSQPIYYVGLYVMDDDNGRGYVSPFARDGMDAELIVLDLR